MPLYVGDYLADTAGLSAEEHGAYLLLIMHYWMTGPLPDDNVRLARMAACTQTRWKAIRSTVERFFKVARGTWRHKRIDQEIDRANGIIQRQKSAGKAGANARWNKDVDSSRIAVASLEQCSNDAPLPLPLPREEESKNLDMVKGARCARKVKAFDFGKPENRQAYARQKMAAFLDPLVLMAAEDPASPNHAEAVELARAAAKRAAVMWVPPAALKRTA
jgi:uncharacterized protein YdaU (DUF1376 family)